jgi:hypothetical protein
MTAQVWEIKYSPTFIKAKDRYTEKLARKVLATRALDDVEAAKRAIKEKDAYKLFLAKITALGEPPNSPTDLMIAYDEHARPIEAFRVKGQPSWVAFLYLEEEYPIAWAVLLFHEGDHPEDLREALELARKR